MKSNFSTFILGSLFALAFFIVGLFTISHYGLNIDEPAHFTRGQAYLHLILTGEKKYSSDDINAPRVSGWKDKQYNGNYFLNNDSGHPSLNDILTAASNRIFYEKLGIVGDLESYHLFEIFISSLLVFLVFVIAQKKFGTYAGIVAAISLALYPLFLGESHFNIKDPVETMFFSATIYFFYLGIEKKSAKFFYLSAISCAFALGTKFNIVFLPFIILPYLVFRFPLRKYLTIKNLKKIPRSIYFTFLSYPIIVFGIHLISRPYLWADPFNRFVEIIQYYQVIGTGINYQQEYLFKDWNLYPPFFISISTPPWILLLSLVGITIAILKVRKEKDKFLLLLLLWFVVPILRVMWPGSSIYSGVRQIMEYIPAMTILAGLGASSIALLISELIEKKLYIAKAETIRISQVMIILLFIPLLFKLIELHPNENVYMNFLVGGVKGAVEKEIPGAAETIGNVYLQGLWWLNENAEKDAGFKLPVGLSSNIPRQFVRKDLKLINYYSGMDRQGEYMMEMTSIDFPPRVYNFLYLDTFLNPVHEVKVDGATLLKVWKNDREHTKAGYLHEKGEKDLKIIGGKSEEFIKIALEEPALVTRLEIEYNNENCAKERAGRITYSLNDEDIRYTPDELFNSQGTYAASLQKDNLFVYFFPAYPARFISLTPDDPNSCLLGYSNIVVKSLRDKKP